MDSTHFNLDINQYNWTTSSEDDEIIEFASTPKIAATREEIDQLISMVIDQSTPQFQKAGNTLNVCKLSDAESIIQKIIQGKVVNFLSPLNILFIEVMKIMQQFSRDRTILTFEGDVYFSKKEGAKPQKEQIHGGQIINLLIIELHLIFRILREYSMLNEGKTASKNKREKIHEAREIYTKIANLYRRLGGIVEANGISNKGLFQNLKQFCDVLYHVSQNEDFLIECSKSLSADFDMINSVMIHPPTLSHMQLYLDSLDISLFSLTFFKKNDITEPIKQVLNELKKLTKVFSPLELFIQSMETFHLNLNKSINEYLSVVQEIIIKTKTDPSNLNLKACFSRLEVNGAPFVEILKEMIPLIKKMTLPWFSFRENHNKTIDRIAAQIVSYCKEFSTSIQSLRAALKKNKSLQGKNRKDLLLLIDSIEKQTTNDCFLSKINALIVESIRIPQNTNQEMICFFVMMDKSNQKAEAFHQSLLMPDSHLPCASFTPIDLFIHQLFQFSEATEQRYTFITAAIGQIKESIKILWTMQADSMALTINNLDKMDHVAIFCKHFTIILNYLDESLNYVLKEENSLIFQRLKDSTHLLIEYLSDFKNIPIIRKHLTSTLLDSLGGPSEISIRDLKMIQQHMQLIATSIPQNEMEIHLNTLESAIKDKLNLASPGQKFFWRLSFKQITLAKLAIMRMLQASHECNQHLKVCVNLVESLLALHEYGRRMKSLERNCGPWTFQITLIGVLAKKEGFKEIYKPIKIISSWNNWINFLGTSIKEILNCNPVSKITLPATINESKPFIDYSDTPSSDNESEEETKPIEISPLLLPLETYQPSSYDLNLSLLDTLKAELPPSVNSQESIQSFYLRTAKRNDLIKNSSIYLTLIEEAKKWNHLQIPQSLRIRGQGDHLLLLEATQKIALIHLRVRKNDHPQIHIISDNHEQKPLIYTHNGLLLVKLIRSAKKDWFDNLELQLTIECQELQLKKVYWFQEKQQVVSGIGLVNSCCEQVWKDLAQPKKVAKKHSQCDQALNFQDCRSKIHKFKRNQAIAQIPHAIYDLEAIKDNIMQLISSLQIDPQCSELIKVHLDAIKRVFDFNQALNSYEKKDEMPLYFVIRSAEIQVSLLSLSLILALSTVRSPVDRPHPLMLNEEGLDEGRPLFHNHRVDKLWKILKSHLNPGHDDRDMLDTYLPLFAGDPRYPHPNKTVMTNELIKMHERVYLLQKLESGWSDTKDQKLFTKYLGKGGRLKPIQAQKQILNQAITKAIEEQRQKTIFAFYLAERILNSFQG